MGSPNRWCSPSLSLSPCPPSTTSKLCQTAGWAQRLSASSTSNTSSCLRDIPHILVLYNRLTHTDRPTLRGVQRKQLFILLTYTFLCLFSLTNVPIRCLNVALWILRAAGPAAVAHHRPGEPGVRESVQVHPLQPHPDTDLPHALPHRHQRPAGGANGLR